MVIELFHINNEFYVTQFIMYILTKALALPKLLLAMFNLLLLFFVLL